MTDSIHKATLLKLLKERAYKKGSYILSSGKRSEHYVNCKPVTLSCEGSALIASLIYKKLDPKSVAVGGLTLGGDPLVQKKSLKVTNLIRVLLLQSWRM